MLKLFLDANIFFAAVCSKTGASNFLFQISEAGNFQLVSNSYAIGEARRNIDHKLGGHKLADFLGLISCLSAIDQKVEFNSDIMGLYGSLMPAKDLPILLGAVTSGSDFLVTLDRKDFKTKKLQEANLPFLILATGEFIKSQKPFSR